jgi:ionotropic glutamate receptor NMDA 3A
MIDGHFLQAPKSWPNKFLINVWGGFSVIFVASYTANIAALFAGMFFERHVDVNDRSVSSERRTTQSLYFLPYSFFL